MTRYDIILQGKKIEPGEAVCMPINPEKVNPFSTNHYHGTKEFYYTWVCPRCMENKDTLGLKSLSPAKCRTCGKKVVAVKIYTDYLDGYKKPVKEPMKTGIVVNKSHATKTSNYSVMPPLTRESFKRLNSHI